MTNEFAVQSMTTTDVAADGQRVRLNFIDTKALRAETSDDAARAVFSLGSVFKRFSFPKERRLTVVPAS